MMFSKETEILLQKAMSQARQRHHEYCLQEHVLLSLLDDELVQRVLVNCGADIQQLALNIENYLNNDIPESKTFQVKPSIAIDRMIQSAILQVQASGKKEIRPVDLLFAISKQENTYAKHFLDVQNVTTDLLKQKITSAGDGSVSKEGEKDYLIDLNAKAAEGKIDGLVGRDHEVERVVQILCRRRKNNPILVGEPGVGKTAIAEGLALRIFNKDVPAKLQNAKVLSLDIGTMMAGTKFRGDFEEKMKEMIKTLKNTPNSILFIDEIHTIIGAGASSGGSLDSANMLKPLLTTGEIKVMGATTYKEYSNIFEKDAALSRRFQKIDVVEPTVEETIQILNGLRPALEKHHEVKYTKDALRLAVELSVKHINDRFLPDKAIDILDEAGSMVHLKGEKTVNGSVIEKTIAKIARIPEKSVSAEETSKLQGLSESLHSKIFGQDEAIETVVSAIEMSSSGLRSGDKPIGNFLFCGPTGVGKTELCKQLSNHLGIPLIRFDMSEYMEKHTVAKLIGAPPGYVGFDQNGLLTDAVRKNPHSIILLDEIEKAHSDVWNVLLQVMDHGTLTDSNGRKADFKNCIVVMTSNVGATEVTKKVVGLSGTGTIQTKKANNAIEMTFTPEFRNRLDAIVNFNPLAKENIVGVLDKNLKELESQLKQKNVEMEISKEAKEWLADKGYSPTMGARPMARLIQDQLKKPLASQILYGELVKGGKVMVSLENGNLVFKYKKAENKEKTSRKTKAKPVLA